MPIKLCLRPRIKKGHKISLLRDYTGYTLTEIMIVIGLMAILTAIAVPSIMSTLPRYRLNGAARQVMGDLMAARMKAVSQNNEFKVFFLSDNHQYTILDDDDNDGVADTGEPPEATETKDIQANYDAITLSKTADPIFYPRGTAYGTTITLTNSKNQKLYVKVALTGRVKIDNTAD